jgi:hypothetical protein
MQGELWQDYGTPGTQALGHKEIEQAIARLTRVWDDAHTRARRHGDDMVQSPQERCDCRHQQAS